MTKNIKPTLVIVEIRPLLDRLKTTSWWLYQKVPLEALVESIVAIPVYSDCSESVWSTIDHHLSINENTPTDEIDSMMLESIEITIENLMDILYQDLTNQIGEEIIQNFVFSHWLGRDSMVLKKST